jgi:hypothetical protein
MSSSSNSFEENIKKWVQLDNQIKLINDKTKEIKDQKNAIEETILSYVEKNNLDNATAKITGGRLKFVDTKQTAPITLKLLEQCLTNCIKDPNQVTQILNYIKEQRETKYVKDIKRYFDKE